MEIYFMIVSFIMGVIFGSFYNVCIFRIPEKLSIINPPSHCYNCNSRLKPLDLVPILSWSMLKGRCRYCGEKISYRYALIEFLTGILFLLVFNKYGYNIQTIYYLIFISMLIIITLIDIDHYIIPDCLIIFGSIVVILANILGQGIGIKNSLSGALICGGSMLILVSLIEFIVKKEVMGGGDIKLFAMTGLFLGIRGGLLTILLSIYVGAFYGIIVIVNSRLKKQEYNSMIPYGPFISIGALIVVLCETNTISWYTGLF